MDDFPVKIICSGYSECSPEWSTKLKISLPFFRVYYIDDGFAAVNICNVRYELLPGNIYFIPGHYPFTNECPERMNVYWFHGLPVNPAVEAFIGRIDKVEYWKMSELDFFKDTIFSFASLDISSLNPGLLKLQSFITYLLAELTAAYGNRETSYEISSSLAKSVEFMDANYIGNPSLRRIASHACLAPNYFHRIFKKAFGITPHEYMERKRMVQARDMLLASEKTLAEVAEKCGYENAFYFSKVFKKHFHVTPGKARRQVLIP
jgi:AraC-like DNA-binding protein